MKIIKWINDFFKKLGDDNVSEYAANCAYYTFLSFIPFIILLLSLVKYINIDRETLAYVLETILPNVMKSSVLDIVQEVYSKSIETVSISAIFMLWSASKSFFALNKGLSAVYDNHNENYIFLIFKGIVGAMLALLLVVVILVLLLFGNSLETVIRERFGEFSGIIDVIFSLRNGFSIIMMFFIFLFVYRVSANKEFRSFKNCFIGASFTAIAWFAISFFFSIYVDIFTNFSVIYGSLATLIIILMWLYAIIYAIFLGAEINTITAGLVNRFWNKIKRKRLRA